MLEIEDEFPSISFKELVWIKWKVEVSILEKST